MSIELFHGAILRFLSYPKNIIVLTTMLLTYIVFPFHMYYLILGILSSIGFGFGIHTGSLIVFPEIIRIAANNTVFLDTIIKVLPVTVCWGIGSAIGELPPFLAAPLFLKMTCIRQNDRVLLYIRPFIQNYGMIAIFLLASYPNVTFDVAGILAGLSQMSLKKFLFATILGKGFVKAPLQAIFIVASVQNLIDFDVHSQLVQSKTLTDIWNKVRIGGVIITSMLCVEGIVRFELVCREEKKR